MADFGSADAKQDTENFHIRRPLREHWIQTGPTLLDPWEMKTSRVADRLYKAPIRRIGIGSRDRGVLTDSERGNCIAEFITEIGISFAAAIAGPEIGVNRELRQIREPSKGLVGTGRLAR